MNKRPHILITNDDGIHAPGIKQLWKSLATYADLTVIAPSTEQSAVGLSITIRQPLKLEQWSWPEGVPVWSVSGTPADCIKIGLHAVLSTPPDIVLSGINRGDNAGRNILYSGTVGGAIEAVMQGIPSIAFSCSDFDNPDYTTAERHIPNFVQYILEHPLAPGTLLNVNFPPRNIDKILGYKLTRQGKRMWGEDPDKRNHPSEGHHYFWLGAKLRQFEEEEESEIKWLEQGYITAVPLHVAELTDHRHLTAHKDHFETVMTKKYVAMTTS